MSLCILLGLRHNRAGPGVQKISRTYSEKLQDTQSPGLCSECLFIQLRTGRDFASGQHSLAWPGRWPGVFLMIPLIDFTADLVKMGLACTIISSDMVYKSIKWFCWWALEIFIASSWLLGNRFSEGRERIFINKFCNVMWGDLHRNGFIISPQLSRTTQSTTSNVRSFFEH